MPFSSLLTLLDDIAAVLDDVAVMSKVAAKKTAGVVGDDLALNAEQVTGVRPDRELAVVWAVARGAMLNKVILIPVALLISAFANFLIPYLLMLGGGFLAFEGFHKVWHKLFHKDESEPGAKVQRKIKMTPAQLEAFEKNKIKGAIRTDFILSAEIIVIALEPAAQEAILTQLGVLCTIGFGLTIFVYGMVAGIVKLDDLGVILNNKGGAAATFGKGLLVGAPMLMKFLGIAGTTAMFLVGGGIFVHNIHAIDEVIKPIAAHAGSLEWLLQMLMEGLVGVIIGALIYAVITVIGKLKGGKGDAEGRAAEAG